MPRDAARSETKDAQDIRGRRPTQESPDGMGGQALSPDDVARFSGTLARSASLVEQVYLLLREMILSGRLRPGDRVVESKIAKQLEVGQPTVRDALRSLEREGLVIHHRNRGCSVTKLSRREYAQISRLRTEWESLAAEMALENWSPEKSSQLAAAAEELLKAGRKGNAEDFYAADLRFHQTLWRCSGNPFLEQALSHITIPLFAFVMVHLLRHDGFDLAGSANQHMRIVEAMDRGSARQARKVVREVLAGFGRQGETTVAAMYE